MTGKDYNNTRYSELSQIDIANAARLKLAFTFSTGVLHGHEAAPLVVGGVMYLVTPFPNYLYALDLAKSGAPLKWKFDPKVAAFAQGVACCDTINRGIAYAKGRIFMNTLDDQTIAVEAASGKELWRNRLGDIALGETLTMAPLVVNDKVLVGNSGGEFGVRGWLAALDAGTGKVVWRAYGTGPDREVLIGPGFRPFYAQDRGVDLGVSTWPGDAWKIGGGTAWGFVSYDDKLNLLYYGTSNPAPWNHEQRPGDNKWTSGIFARNPDTGEARWFYQTSPHDLHDYDGTNENVLIDLPGTAQPVLIHPDRNGYMYVLDRATGQIISAQPYSHVTTSKGVDAISGRLLYAPEKEPKSGKVVRTICPASPGAKDWQPSAYSPRTRWLYVPMQNLCQDMEATQVSYIAGTPYVGSDQKIYAGPGGNRGEFAAWDPVGRRKMWDIKEKFPVWSGALVTGGDVVFYGTLEGWFKAVNANTGALLWRFKTGSGIVGQPISYLGPDGKQYIAILSGVGGWAGAVVTGNLDTRDPTAASGFANALADLPAETQMGGMLYVFALPE